MNKAHVWVGKMLKDITLPPEVIVAAIYREGELIVPNGKTEIMAEDRLVLGAHLYEAEDDEIRFTEVIIKSENPWVGKKIRDLDISRKELIVRIRRRNKTIIPSGDVMIKSGDVLLLLSGKKQV
jgi:Trk K+ transport system NAD-binding subunit